MEYVTENHSFVKKSVLPSFIAVVVATVAACAVRVYQLLNITEQRSGFYTDASNWSVKTLYGILAAVGVLCFVLFVLNAVKEKKSAPTPSCQTQRSGRDIFMGLLVLVMCAAFFVDFVSQAASIVELYSSYNHLIPLFQYVYSSGIVPMAFQGLLALCTCFYFTIYAAGCFGASVRPASFRVLSLAPSLWLMCRMIVHFMTPIRYLNVSQRLFEMFAIILGMVFFFNFAKSCSEMKNKFSVSKITASALAFGCMALVSCVPRLIVMMIGKGSLLPESSATVVTDVMAGIFALSCVLNFYKR